MSTVLVSGAIANKPRNGGAAWTRLNWILGLKRLGFTVVFLEQIAPSACVDASGAVVAFEASENRRYFREVCQAFDLRGSAALVCGDGAEIEGLPRAELLDAAADASFLINISGHLTWEPAMARVGCRVYVDLDPGFTQFWQEAGSSAARLERHHLHYTVGVNVGTPRSAIPTCGLTWRPVRQPIVLDEWPVSNAGDPRRFTTVATWRGPYGPVERDGVRYGVKVHEFRKVLDLPRCVDARFELALDIHAAESRDRAALAGNGWHVVDAPSVVPDPDSFRAYVQTSGAEFSVAQQIYVETNSGWFSDRTVRYLASGKPALVQDTGFAPQLPAREGLVAFRSRDEAIQGASRILEDYDGHCRAARAIAEQYFDARRVLGDLVEDVQRHQARAAAARRRAVTEVHI